MDCAGSDHYYRRERCGNLRHEADLAGITLVLLCTSTEIFDLALAVAILMASYLTLLRMRENRDKAGRTLLRPPWQNSTAKLREFDRRGY